MDNETKIYISAICRICLCEVSKESVVSLFNKYEGTLLYTQINAITNIDIEENDNLPDKLCSQCFLELNTSIKFIQKCENSNKVLRSSHKSNNAYEFKEYYVKSEPEEDIVDDAFDHNESLEKEIERSEKEAESSVEEEANYFKEEDSEDHLKEVVPEENAIDYKQSGLFRPSRAIDLNLECNECGNLFKSKCKIAVHWKKVHFPESLICSLCKRSFKSISALKNHEASWTCKAVLSGTFHIEGVGKSRIFKCKECSYTSKKFDYINVHVRQHTGEKPFKCNLCTSSFAQQSSLISHKESIHEIYKVEMTCPFCGKFYAGRSAVYHHLRVHRKEQIECKICKKLLKNKKCLALHMLRHSGVKNFSCDKCTSAFYTNGELYNHTFRVHDPYGKSKKFVCAHCNFKLRTREALIIHESKHISGQVSCMTCGLFVASQEKLLIHQAFSHSPQKNIYSCPICDKKYTIRSSLGNHLRKTHEFYIKSSTCPKVFPKNKVIKHRETVVKSAGKNGRNKNSN